MSNSESREYRNTSTGQDGRKLIEILKKYLTEKSTLLILGLGSGRDFELLSKNYKVTGSDFSKLLLSMYQNNNPETDLIVLDPADPKTDRTFDCIYSNKVLNQMDESDFANSLEKQLLLLNKNGFVIHSFWSGTKQENHHGLKWAYYTEDKIISLIPDEFEIVELSSYKEKLDYDSIYMILRKK